MSAAPKQVRAVLGKIDKLRTDVQKIDVPEENEHLQSYALDGLYSAQGYLETLLHRLEEELR